jgi:quinol monooxygenase YgiN
MAGMVNCGVFVRLEAKEGKETEVESFLSGALDLVNQEAETPMWFAVKFSPSSFAIYDVFESNDGREDHLGGQVAAGLMARADELFANKLSIELFDVLAAKLP